MIKRERLVAQPLLKSTNLLHVRAAVMASAI